MRRVTSLMHYSGYIGWALSGREGVGLASCWRYIFVWRLRSGIYDAVTRIMLLPYLAMPSELG